ncbi:hypothetical protein [Nannocystis exedens]|uniref:hypothetical protein n=1 Tax=Nannocystis exedens TaxID=54 RepID=UPI0015A571C0|nr:hypothetical protein [Nannocystis exedens]
MWIELPWVASGSRPDEAARAEALPGVAGGVHKPDRSRGAKAWVLTFMLSASRRQR